MILIKNTTIITQNPQREIIEKGGLVIEKDAIEAIGQSKEIERQYGRRAEKIINGQNKVVLPGLINAHGHLAMTLLRGFADDLSLEDWWFKYVYRRNRALRPSMFTGVLCWLCWKWSSQGRPALPIFIIIRTK